MRKCKICGRYFSPKKSKRYEIVKMPTGLNALVEEPTIYECFDCPRCGCQNIANIREDNPLQRQAEAREYVERTTKGNTDTAAEQNKREGK